MLVVDENGAGVPSLPAAAAVTGPLAAGVGRGLWERSAPPKRRSKNAPLACTKPSEAWRDPDSKVSSRSPPWEGAEADLEQPETGVASLGEHVGETLGDRRVGSTLRAPLGTPGCGGR